MTKIATSTLGFENRSSWRELENSIKCMQVVPKSKGSYETGSSSSSSDYDEDVMRAVKEDDCIIQMLRFVKKELRAILIKTPNPMKSCFTAEVVQCDDAPSETNENEKGFWGRLWNSLKNFIYNLKEAIKCFWKWIIDILKKLLNMIKQVIMKFSERVGELMLIFYSTAEEAAGKSVKVVTTLLFEQIEEVLKSYMEALVKAHSI